MRQTNPKKSHLESCVKLGTLNIVRFNGQKQETDPNCELCDGYGENAKKYGWHCYRPLGKLTTSGEYILKS